MNSIQNYSVTAPATSFKGVKQQAKRLMDYPLVRKVLKENPTVHPSKILEIVKTKVQDIMSRDKELQAGKITKDEACNKALNLIL